MSKSLGTVVDPLKAADRLGPDPLRFYLAKEIAFGQDGDFTWERFEERYNVDLANNFGNLVSRVVSMAHRYRQGRLVVPAREPGPLAAVATDTVSVYRRAMDGYALHQGIEAAFSLIDATNEYITTVEPWVVAKDADRGDELDRQLCDMAESVRIAATLLTPVMPSACREVLARVGTVTATDSAAELYLDRDGAWTTPPGAERRLVKGPALWPRLEQGALTMNDDTNQTPVTASKEPISVVAEAQESVAEEELRISIDEFFKVELRVGRVVMAEAVPKSKKLLRLEVETGSGIRQIVSGIAKSYMPESLVGRHVVYVANLKPAKLMGIESNGMVLAATDANGEAVLIEPEDVTRAPAGSEVK
jgi:methionyl-tRNA synthetase